MDKVNYLEEKTYDSVDNKYEEIKLHKKQIRNLKKQVKLSKAFQQLKKNPLFKEIFDKWLFEDELVRLSKMYGQLNDMDRPGKYNKKQVIKAITAIGVLDEKLKYLEGLEIDATEAINRSLEAIELLNKTEVEGEDNE